jgi:hypothetical protein
MIMQKYLGLTPEVAKGLGALSSVTYAALNSNREAGQDSLLQGQCEAIGLDDRVPTR